MTTADDYMGDFTLPFENYAAAFPLVPEPKPERLHSFSVTEDDRVSEDASSIDSSSSGSNSEDSSNSKLIIVDDRFCFPLLDPKISASSGGLKLETCRVQLSQFDCGSLFVDFGEFLVSPLSSSSEDDTCSEADKDDTCSEADKDDTCSEADKDDTCSAADKNDTFSEADTFQTLLKRIQKSDIRVYPRCNFICTQSTLRCIVTMLSDQSNREWDQVLVTHFESIFYLDIKANKMSESQTDSTLRKRLTCAPLSRTNVTEGVNIMVADISGIKVLYSSSVDAQDVGAVSGKPNSWLVRSCAGDIPTSSQACEWWADCMLSGAAGIICEAPSPKPNGQQNSLFLRVTNAEAIQNWHGFETSFKFAHQSRNTASVYMRLLYDFLEYVTGIELPDDPKQAFLLSRRENVIKMNRTPLVGSLLSDSYIRWAKETHAAHLAENEGSAKEQAVVVDSEDEDYE